MLACFPTRLTKLALGAAILAALETAGAKADEIVQFESATYPPSSYQLERSRQTGIPPVMPSPEGLEGRLIKPDGQGPFPAVVVLHGCGGIWRWNDYWSSKLTDWGYLVLNVDSFGPRGKASICDDPGLVPGVTRALDAHGAKSYLSSLPSVDRSRIAVLGMSHGGWATLDAIQLSTTSGLGLKPFRAAVALYPSCTAPTELASPLLILIGEKDDWTPAKRCEDFVAKARSSHALMLKEYPGVYHLFDLPGIDEQQQGHVLRYDAPAANDVVERVKAFLAEHL